MFQARDQFEQLTYEQIYEELSRDTIEMHLFHEYDLFTMTCTWIEANRSEREKYVEDLFKLIRFMLMTPEQLCDHVRDHEFIKINEQTRILVQNALCYYALPNRQPLLNDIQCRIRNEPVLVAVGEIELFTLNTIAERWDTLCQAPLEENYPVGFYVTRFEIRIKISISVSYTMLMNFLIYNISNSIMFHIFFLFKLKLCQDSIY